MRTHPLKIILVAGVFVIFINLVHCYRRRQQRKPNIVIILADDLGVGDVSFRGSNNVLTPNIDALAYNGVILDRYYVSNLCTPSRAALFTGKYPIHTGTQHSVIINYEPWGLPLNHTLLPEILRANGYSTNIIGKWHLGFWKKALTPLKRGFDFHYGYYGGYIDYFDHTSYMGNSSRGYDTRRNFKPDFSGFGVYATDLYTTEAVRVIKEHDQRKPLFLFLSHLAVHRGNDDKPFQAPPEEIEKFDYLGDPEKQIYAAMRSKLDKSVGRVMRALSVAKMLDNTIVLFYSDNGAAVMGATRNGGSNYPLRGQKYSPFEGGIRTPGVLYSPLLKRQQTISQQVLYVADWFPTLASAAGIKLSPKLNLDGLDMWDTLVDDKPPKEREIVHNINPISGYSMYMRGDYKYINGTTINGVYDHWLSHLNLHETDPRATQYAETVLNSIVGKVLKTANLTEQKINEMRTAAVIGCPDLYQAHPIFQCRPKVKPCLFNLLVDPCERYNLAEVEPKKFEELHSELQKHALTVVRPENIGFHDPRSDPRLHNYVWTWWEKDDDDGGNRLSS